MSEPYDDDDAPFPAAGNDKLEVTRYLSSDQYERHRVSSAGDPAISTKLVEPGVRSLVFGLAGLGGLTAVLAIIFPVGVYVLNEASITPQAYTLLMLVIQTIFLPPMVGFCFAAVTPMFWYGSLLARFFLAALTVIPGCLTFVLALALVEGLQAEFWVGFAAVMFATFMSIAAIAMGFQWWTRWTLTHWREESDALPPKGVRSLIEMTVIAAIGFTAFRSRDLSEYYEGIVWFAGIGALAAVTIISALIGYFLGGLRRRIAAIVGSVFAFSIAFLVTGFFAVQEYGWTILTAETLYIGLVSLYGTLVTCGTTWAYLRWLRFCRWQCVDRKDMLTNVRTERENTVR